MSSVDEQFQKLSKFFSNKDTRPQMDTKTKLTVYGLWQQATNGNINIPKPSRFNLVATYKWDAWKKNENMSKEDAKKKFIETCNNIQKSKL